MRLISTPVVVTVRRTASGVRYELRVPAAVLAGVGYELEGELQVQAGRVVGRLTFATLTQMLTDPTTGSTIRDRQLGLKMQTL